MKLSVLISVYIKEMPSRLNECLHSLVNQTLKADEVVLVQDGPLKSELQSVIDQYREALNIVSVVLKENVGLATALNVGLKFCKHAYVARMDSDDVALPDRLRIQSNFMLSNPFIDACSGTIEEFDDCGRILGYRKLPLHHDEIVEFCKRRSPLSHPAVMFKKSAVLDVGGYPVIYPEDHLLWVKLILNGYRLANVQDIIVRMRTNEAILTRRGYNFLKGQIFTFNYMYRSGFINFSEYLRVVISVSILRLSPGFIKIYLYRYAR